ncbi:MAG: FKBP-type peptidyl-prolyl cis-trans isomerase [Prevotellaceae bacterium]|jgi:FKBP-type peptidyl-prolyl cis-trans isomerase|nr:FKBP-type peptidyl-prolyl cis-trans isomerase [Prevotellaceae bacterium]
MKRSALSGYKRYVRFCFLLTLAVAPSCKDDDTEEKQRESIERYITATLRAEVDEKDGVYYVPRSVDSSPDRVPVEPGDMVELEYEAMTLSGVLFAASNDSTAWRNGLEPYPGGGNRAEVEVGSGKLIAGLDRGLLRMALGEQALLLFPFTLGYGNEHVGLVPSQSALIFNVLVTKVDKRY